MSLPKNLLSLRVALSLDGQGRAQEGDCRKVISKQHRVNGTKAGLGARVKGSGWREAMGVPKEGGFVFWLLQVLCKALTRYAVPRLAVVQAEVKQLQRRRQGNRYLKTQGSVVDLVTGSLRECVCPLPARGMLEKGWGKRACALGREGGREGRHQLVCRI